MSGASSLGAGEAWGRGSERAWGQAARPDLPGPRAHSKGPQFAGRRESPGRRRSRAWGARKETGLRSTRPGHFELDLLEHSDAARPV